MLLRCIFVPSYLRRLSHWILARAIWPARFAVHSDTVASERTAAQQPGNCTNEAPLPDGALQNILGVPAGQLRLFHLGTIRPPTPPTSRFPHDSPATGGSSMAEAWRAQETREPCPRVGLEPIGWPGWPRHCSPVIGCPSQHQSMTHLRHVPALWAMLDQTSPSPSLVNASTYLKSSLIHVLQHAS